uniref:JmjC domain-containing protein n=1 Tax=Chrysotila carterae TaxID=13221 RepID=A0A7S4ERC8_CHRCT
MRGRNKKCNASDDGSAVLIETHPLGVCPYGMQLQSSTHSNLRNQGGLGALAILPDMLILQILAEVGAAGVAACRAASSAFLIFASSEDLWRNFVLEELPYGRPLSYHGSWRATYIVIVRNAVAPTGQFQLTRPGRAKLYSDVLFGPWQCGTASIPMGWTSFENIPRIHANDLSVAEFAGKFEHSGLPVILTGLASKWPAFKRWSLENLATRFGEVPFHVSGYVMKLRDFLEYSASTRDEMPLYLFDKQFAQRTPQLADEYIVPDYFAEARDMFSQLPADCRPDYRWLIIGGTRSGSLWHVDPNATSAWNAVVRGEKKWILTPPDAPPPGVTASDDGATLTSPLSVYEWYRAFYPSLARRRGTATGPREAVVRAGEILFVPRGWWHTALNCMPTIAITQNYVPESSARHVLDYLSSGDAPALVSGVPVQMRSTLYKSFAQIVKALEGAPSPLDEKLQRAPGRPPSLWRVITQEPPGAHSDCGSRRETSVEAESSLIAPPASDGKFTVKQGNGQSESSFAFSF